jgi:hypothetical protein
MLRKLWVTAAAVGGLAVANPASAGDDAMKLGRFQPGTAGFSGGTSAADVDQGPPADTERTHFYRRWGYAPYWGGYYGYRSFYYGGPYWGGGYYNFYRPGFAVSYYAAPRFYYPTYVYPGWGWGGYYGAGFFPISGGTNIAVETPTLALNLTLPPKGTTASYSSPLPAPAPATVPQPAAPAPGTYQYDGGPKTPVPQPAPDATPPARPQAAPAPEATAMRTAQPKAKTAPAKPVYRYTAYGEK